MVIQDMLHSLTRKKISVYQFAGNARHKDDDMIHRLHWSFGILGIIGFLLNILVILRILIKGIRKAHVSRQYIFSLAVSDMLFGGTCFLYILFVEKVVSIDNPRALSIWFVLMAGISFTSSLLTIILITADRFLAIAYPFIHMVKVTRRRVLVSIIIVWLISILLTSTEYWIHKMVFDWVVVVAGISGSFGLIVTYIHIGRVARNRKKTLHENGGNNVSNRNGSSISTKSLNATYLGFFITLTFIICNLPFSVTTIVYMEDEWNIIVVHVIFILMTGNTVLNPIIYTVVEIVNKVINKRRRTHHFRNAVVMNIVNPTFETS